MDNSNTSLKLTQVTLSNINLSYWLDEQWGLEGAPLYKGDNLD